MKRIFLFILVFGLYLSPVPAREESEKIFPASEKPAGKIFLGEKITYQISYLGIPVGEAVMEVKEIAKIKERNAYHVVVTARSAPILEWIYPVMDEHHTYIDTERFHSLRYEKKINEGNYHTHELMEYDQEKHLGEFYSYKDKSRKEMIIPPNVQDQISCGYWFRLQDVKPKTKLTMPVNADEKNWDLDAVTYGVKQKKIDGVGVFQAIEVEPVLMFEGFFMRRGKIRGWMSMDERRIPLVMKVNVPVLGSVKAVLTQYEPGQESTN
ncbi:MAG TPA: DUF3108 domain-containing protein [Candidatus Omnitrophota bacterium]|nr:DUF3108 domain-containing protein [Candidatus Omnitrophota bacterium]HPS36123.1 DUF3108 domain-containing protein [Candidatus Omnitrophota bacterium]